MADAGEIRISRHEILACPKCRHTEFYIWNYVRPRDGIMSYLIECKKCHHELDWDDADTVIKEEGDNNEKVERSLY